MKTEFFPIAAFKDNYIWLIRHIQSSQTLIVDPGEAAPVLQALRRLNLKPIGILVTHHHADHTAGIPELKQHYTLPVYGPTIEAQAHVTHPLKEGDFLRFPELCLTLHVFDTPGHTLGHIMYYGQGCLLTGDTLFTGGAGRLFEGTALQLWQSLQKVKKLPPETLIYCGHEYTEANLKFAKMVEPNNLYIQSRLEEVSYRRLQGLPTVPSTLFSELATNPFLRTGELNLKKSVEAHFNKIENKETGIFSLLREWKNQYS